MGLPGMSRRIAHSSDSFEESRRAQGKDPDLLSMVMLMYTSCIFTYAFLSDLF